ncbi:MAG: four helix bundle protein [Verrucomicrobia bacterium]|nr:four helix bundle protein [Verrucomicrobiota bacterium]
MKCWQACRDLKAFVRVSVVPILPKEERCRLTDQLIRAARSTTANIAEGYGRFHYLDNAKFCSNSRGSCWEVLDHFITAHEEAFIDEKALSEGRKIVNTAIKILNGYITYLQNSSRSAKSTNPSDPDNG